MAKWRSRWLNAIVGSVWMPGASAAYGNAIRYGYPDSTAQLYLAQSLHAEGKYQPAIQAYERYIELDPSSVVAATGLSGARTALTMKQTPTRYVVKQPKTLNSRRADFSPMFCGKDLDVLYFTTTNEKVTGNARSEITGMKKGDIWLSRKKRARRVAASRTGGGRCQYRRRRRCSVVFSRRIGDVSFQGASRTQFRYRSGNIHFAEGRGQVEFAH